MKTEVTEYLEVNKFRVLPANQASWEDLLAIFGTADYPGRCYCQHYKTRDSQ